MPPSKPRAEATLYDACVRGDVGAVKSLLGSRRAPRALLYRDDVGNSALHAACLSGSVECVRAILNESRGLSMINLQSELGKTPLMLAAEHGHGSQCGALLLSRRQCGDLR